MRMSGGEPSRMSARSSSNPAAPPPELESGEQIRQLPDTASDAPALGLAGAGSLAAAWALRAVRRRFFL